MSPRLPMGVLTRKRVPAVAELMSRLATDPADYAAACCLNFSASAGLPMNPINELAVLEKQNGRNRPDIEFGHRLDVHIHIDLRDLRLAFVFDRKLIQH